MLISLSFGRRSAKGRGKLLEGGRGGKLSCR